MHKLPFKQESPAVADKPARRESMPKIAPIRCENKLQTSCVKQVNLFEVMEFGFFEVSEFGHYTACYQQC